RDTLLIPEPFSLGNTYSLHDKASMGSCQVCFSLIACADIRNGEQPSQMLDPCCGLMQSGEEIDGPPAKRSPGGSGRTCPNHRQRLSPCTIGVDLSKSHGGTAREAATRRRWNGPNFGCQRI